MKLKSGIYVLSKTVILELLFEALNFYHFNQVKYIQSPIARK